MWYMVIHEEGATKHHCVCVVGGGRVDQILPRFLRPQGLQYVAAAPSGLVALLPFRIPVASHEPNVVVLALISNEYDMASNSDGLSHNSMRTPWSSYALGQKSNKSSTHSLHFEYLIPLK